MKELKVWLRYTNNSFERTLMNRGTTLLFVVAKIMRIGLFLAFLGFLFQGANNLAGYSGKQIIFFYLAFNFIDTGAQFFFREVYRFRPLIVSGDFDFVLTKPLNPLVRVLLGGTDILDLITLTAITAALVIFSVQNFSIEPVNLLIFALLLGNSVLIAATFHIVVLGLGIITTNIDQLVMIYRDMASLARIPIDVYVEPIRFLLTFILPLAIMITFPTKAVLGLLSWQLVFVSLFLGVAGIFVSLKFWTYAVKQYSSASS